MPAVWAALRALLTQLGAILAALGLNNLVGWTVGTVVSVSFIAIWITVLNYVFSYLFSALVAPSGIFGGLPAGALWLIQQGFPLQLFCTLAVTALMVRMGAAKLLVIAIAATRYLKGK